MDKICNIKAENTDHLRETDVQFERKHGCFPQRAPPPSFNTDNVSLPSLSLSLSSPSTTAVQEISHPPSTAVAMATQRGEIHSLFLSPPPPPSLSLSLLSR